MSAVLDYLKDCGVFYIATMDGDQPLVANPKVEISAMKGQDSWIRLDGEAKFDDRREARVAMLKAVPVLKNMYNPDDGVMVVFYLDNVKATVCSFTEEPKELA